MPPRKKKAELDTLPNRDHRLSSLAKFDQSKATGILDAIAKGANHKTAANLAGVSARTLSEWLQRGENDPDGPFGQWALDVRQAQATFEQEMLQRVIEIAGEKGKWEGFMTILERRFSEHWRRPSEAAQVQVNIGNFEKSLREVDGGIIDAEIVPGD